MRITFAVTLCLLIAFSVFLKFTPKPAKPTLQSQWANNQYLVEKYLRTQSINPVDTLIIGSSLTDRLDFSEKANCVYRLSLSGDSSLTALAVAMKSGKTPKNIWVEINYPERDVNLELIRDATGYSKAIPAFQIENRPLSLALGYLHQAAARFNPPHIIGDAEQQEAKTDTQPTSNINETVRQNAIALQTGIYKGQLQSNILLERMDKYMHFIKELESKGAIVGFFELPIYPNLRELPRAVQVREAFKKYFPQHQLISFADLSNGLTIKTSDGVHLQENEASAVVKNFDFYLPANCNLLR